MFYALYNDSVKWNLSFCLAVKFKCHSKLFQKWCSSGVVGAFLFRKTIDFTGFSGTFQDTAVKDQIVMPFVEYYPIIRPILEHEKLRVPRAWRQSIQKLADGHLLRDEIESENEVLTAREMEIMECLAKGMSNAEIAKELVISLNTVKRHIQNIYRKLDVPNKTLAILRYQEQKKRLL